MPRHLSVRAVCGVLALLASAACSSGPSSSAPAGSSRRSADAAGIGDSLFPRAGNGGYDVGHYGLDLDYTPDGNRLKGTARITARATRTLTSFHLDLSGLRVRKATVDGTPARVHRSGTDLTLTPAVALPRGRAFETTVVYDGVPKTVTDADGTDEGWIETEDGSAALGEPVGSMSWFPGNNHPSDKATYDIDVTVPEGFTAVANGELKGREQRGGRTTFRWHNGDPMATYLATVAVGTFSVRRGEADGIPMYVAVDPTQRRHAARVPAEIARITAWEHRLFGPYPFASTGAIVDDLPDYDYALETQTKPYFSSAPDTLLLVHELAHQYFGDSVTPRRWKDIWLNEGFASYSEWLWEEDHGGRTTQQIFEDYYDGEDDQAPGIWDFPPGDPPGPAHLLDPPVYGRGAMVLHQVRRAVGDETFFAILRAWVKEHRHGNADTRQFVDLCEKRSGKDLGELFDTWLYGEGKPDLD